MIYKICHSDEWHDAVESGCYSGSRDDARDGFIHFSTADQLAGTLARHFAGQSDLVLIAVAADRLGSALKWEKSKGRASGGGSIFPHLYDELDISAIEWSRPLPHDEDGRHVIPDGLI